MKIHSKFIYFYENKTKKVLESYLKIIKN